MDRSDYSNPIIRKINAIVTSDGPPDKVDALLKEEDITVNAFKMNSIPKVTAFMCERENLLQLIQYSVKFPEEPENREKSHKFPYFATDVLASNNMLL